MHEHAKLIFLVIVIIDHQTNGANGRMVHQCRGGRKGCFYQVCLNGRLLIRCLLVLLKGIENVEEGLMIIRPPPAT
jgi:hypothetical protein